jgi:hypothetical protein
MAATMKSIATTIHKCWELQTLELQLSTNNNQGGVGGFLVIDNIKHDHMMNGVHS